MVQVGEWTSAGGLSIMDKYAFTEGRPPNITLKVLSRIEEPFVMFRKVRRGIIILFVQVSQGHENSTKV